MKSNIIVAVDHDAASVGIELLIVPHASMSGHVILEASEYALAQLPLEYRGTPCHLAVTELVRASAWPTALAALARASTMKPTDDVLAIAHEPCRLAERLAIFCLLTGLALIGSDA